MISRPLPFFSNGSRLDADLHLPEDDGAGAPYLVLVAASGYQGQKVIHPETVRAHPDPARVLGAGLRLPRLRTSPAPGDPGCPVDGSGPDAKLWL